MALMADVAPHVQPAYRQAGAMSAGVLLTCLREELDRVAERRIDENAALRALFRDGAGVVGDAALGERLAAAAAGEGSGYRISQLDADNAALRALLVELHAAVEGQEGAAARDLEARIWRELAASTERRRLSLGAF